MTFLELYGEQLDIQLGSADRVQLFTTALRKQAINKANERMALQTRCTESTITFSMTTGVPEYDLEPVAEFIMPLGDPYIRIIPSAGAHRFIEGKDLIRRDPPRLSLNDPGWRSAEQGTPTHFYYRSHNGQNYIGFYPTPELGAGETWSGNLQALVKPDDMVTDPSEPFTIGGNPVAHMRPYHMALVHYAASLLEPLRKNYTQVKEQLRYYSGYVAEYLSSKTETNELTIFYARDYLGEASGLSRPPDPRRWP